MREILALETHPARISHSSHKNNFSIRDFAPSTTTTMTTTAPNTGAPRATNQSSRKGKKAWRKNVDISAVETGLETVREEIVATGFVVLPTAHQYAY
jgi:hypothetical protein